MLKMVMNIKVPQGIHRFIMGIFLSEAYSKHLYNLDLSAPYIHAQVKLTDLDMLLPGFLKGLSLKEYTKEQKYSLIQKGLC